MAKAVSSPAADARRRNRSRSRRATAIEPQKDCPLKVSGNLEIASGTGHTLDRCAQTWLCRCGQSQNKPYCDGSHRKSGFVADGA